MDCLATLVGLSKIGVACWGDAPSGYDNSDSGFFLVDAMHGVPINGNESNATAWQVLADARSAAIIEMVSDIQMALSSRYQNTGSTTAEWVGKREHGGGTPTGGSYGWRVTPDRSKSKSKVLIIPKVAISQATGGSRSLKVFDNTGELLYSATVNAGSSSFPLTTLQGDGIVVPLYKEDDPDLAYTIVIGGANATVSTLVCCGGGYHLDTALEIQAGICDEFGNNFVNQSGAMGISFLARIECADSEWLCSMDKAGQHHIRNVVARMVQARGSALAIQRFITEGYIGFNTLYNSDALAQLANERNTNYRGYLNWLAENLPPNFSKCWTCHEGRNAQKIPLLV